jgi:uncharacterized membrane protein YhaH (DUF805 family)
MGFSEAVGACLSNYATFRGRAPRSEYWYFVLFQVFASLVAGAISAKLELNLITTLVELALFLPSLAVAVRRLHDIDKSGWWLLVGLVPLIGWVFIIIWACTKGSLGANRFGPDPQPTLVGAAA